ESGHEAGHGPVLPLAAERLLIELEARGIVLRDRTGGRQAGCDRRHLARIQRYPLERLRREIEPVTAAELWRYLACWQHVDSGHRLEGPRGVMEVVSQLAGFEVPAAEWESCVLPARVRDYRPEWLDQLVLTGEVVWGRLWGSGNSPLRSTPLCLLPRGDLDAWLALTEGAEADPERGAMGNGAPPIQDRRPLSEYARSLLRALESRGASFAQDLQRVSGLLPSHFEMGLNQLISHGLLTCDTFGGVRRIVTTRRHRRGAARQVGWVSGGRWSRFRPPAGQGPGGNDRDEAPDLERDSEAVAFAARQLLARYGVVFKRLLERERIPVPWRDLVRAYRRMELRGDLRGGRFVQRFAGEQYAMPQAVELMRRLRRRDPARPEAGARTTSGAAIHPAGEGM